MSRNILIEQMRADADGGIFSFDAGQQIDRVFTALAHALEADQRVTIPGFGTFRRKFRDTRQVRNPKTGERSTMLAHYAVTFKASKPGKRKAK